MAEDFEGENAVGTPAGSGSDLAALALAVSSGPLDPRAAAYLEKQSRLADKQERLLDIQIEDAAEQHDLHISHLRFRRFGDYAKAAMETAVALVIVFLAAGLASLVWQAHEASGLVAEPLKTPPDFAAKGLDGTVLAQQLLDKLNRLVSESESTAFRAANAISGDWGDDSKVEIPDTGVSVAEFSRALRNWLGSETRMSGEVWHDGEKIVVTVRAGNSPAVEVRGAENGLDQLLNSAAEKVLAETQPYRYAALLVARGQLEKAITFVTPIALAGRQEDRAWAYTYWADAQSLVSDQRKVLELANESIRLDPSDPSPYFVKGGADVFLG